MGEKKKEQKTPIAGENFWWGRKKIPKKPISGIILVLAFSVFN